MDFHPSADTHRVSHDDVRHAVEHFVYAADIDADEPPARVLYVGPDRAGNLLEVVVIEREIGSDLVIHAMKMRHRYEEFLPKQDEL